MKSNESTLFDTNAAVSELNKVAGFDPMRYVRNTASGAVLDLPYKKLWFRLKNPNGKIRLFKHKVSEKVAIIEAKVYLDRRDSEPVSSFTAQREKSSGNRYIEEAEHAAIDEALSDAGYGIQFISSVPGDKPQAVETKPKAVQQKKTETVAPKVTAENPGGTVEVKAPLVIQKVEAPEPIAKTETVAKEQKPDLLQFVEDDTPAVVQSEVKTEDPLLAFAKVLDGKNGADVAQNDSVAKVSVESGVANDTTLEETTSTPPYTKDMSVEEICSMMSVDDAENYVVNIGSVKGMTVKDIYDSPRRAVLRMYMDPTKYKGDDNILRAAATLVLASHGESIAA